MSEEEPFYPDLCTELHQRTLKAHDTSNKLVNLKLLVALTDAKLYGLVLKDFYYVFQAIEDSLEVYQCQDEEFILALRNPRWYRASQLAQDVTFFLGPDWRKQNPPSPAAVKYVDRINYVMEKEPVLIFAHAQTMFMAALAGGQILKKIVRKGLGLTGSDGLLFFEFPDDNVVSVKADIRSSVNGLKMEKKMIDRVVAEKELIFQLNNGIAANVELSLMSFRRIGMFLLICIVICLLLVVVVKMCF